jgi:hypothetical protein
MDVLDREVKLALVPLRVAAELAATVGQHAQQLNRMRLEGRQHPVIQEISRRDRGLAMLAKLTLI